MQFESEKLATLFEPYAGRKVLFGVLNWGLGHATRCVPLIRAALHVGCQVQICSDGQALMVLQAYFPNLSFHQIPAYNVDYKRKLWLWDMVLQSPKIGSAIIAEYLWLHSFLKTESFDLIISDNRYGFFSPSRKSVLITHQLSQPLLPTIMNWGFELLVDFWASNFHELWIPDHPGSKWTGGLTTRVQNQPKIKWLGLLSALESQGAPMYHSDLLIVLSGPEPNRTAFERKICRWLDKKKLCATLIRGTLAPFEYKLENVKVIDRIHDSELAGWMLGAKRIICRSGYSSIMDLILLDKNDVCLVPTSGQIEQIYLAKWLKGKTNWNVWSEDDFDIL